MTKKLIPNRPDRFRDVKRRFSAERRIENWKKTKAFIATEAPVNKMALAQMMKSARLSAKLTLTELAGLAGVSESSLSAWEAGTRRPKSTSILKIEAATNYPLTQILNEEALKLPNSRNLLVLADALIDARTKANLTQRQLAKLIGINQSAIARLESGQHYPSFSTIEKIATATRQTINIEIMPN